MCEQKRGSVRFGRGGKKNGWREILGSSLGKRRGARRKGL